MKRYKFEDYIAKANLVHNNKYDYSQAKWEGIKGKLYIICPEHGGFWQSADGHMRGRGCPKCARERNAELQKIKRSTTEQFIAKSKEIFGNKYTYEKTKYITAKTPVIITCPIHGDFEVNPHYHLTRFCGCKLCKNEAISKSKTSNTEQFIEKAKRIHGDRYNYSKVNYVNAHTPVCIICPIHGEFMQIPNKHLSGHNCPKCRRSSGEELIELMLKKLNVKFATQVKHILPNRTLWFDFEVYVNNEIHVIEYNGIQHYQACDFFGGEEIYLKQVERDNDLREYCKTNNYKLLEIKYTETDDSIKQLIGSFINVPISSDTNSKPEELLETPEMDNQQPSLGLTTEEGSETNTWNLNEEYNSDTSIRHLEIDDDIVRTT